MRSFCLLSTTLIFLAITLAASLSSKPGFSPTPAYAQSTPDPNAWNIQRITGTNMLNFFFGTGGPLTLQLNPTTNQAGIKSLYDLDSSTFKLDPSGTSILEDITFPNNGTLITMPEIANTAYNGFTSNGNGNMSDNIPFYWGIGREPGTWVPPYPDLVINNHTGIRLAAHGGYGGVSIYENGNNPSGVPNDWTSTGNEIARFRDDRDFDGAGPLTGGSYFLTKLGIGTTAPTHPLHIHSASTHAFTKFETTGTAGGSSYIGQTRPGLSNLMVMGSGTFSETTPPAIAINSTNNVGIGTVAPSSRLHVTGATNTHNFITIQSIGGTLAGSSYIGQTRGGHNNLLVLGNGAYSDGAATIAINSSNNVGIGTENPSQKLHVSGNILASGNIQASGSLIVSTLPSVPGNYICRDSGGTFGNCPSDKRLKENIYPLNDSGLDIILKLKPSIFDFKKGPKNQAGFIAQDVLEVLPKAVNTGSDGYYGLNDPTFTPYLVKAIQELSQDNELLKQNLDAQQNQIDQLRKEIQKLEDRL